VDTLQQVGFVVGMHQELDHVVGMRAVVGTRLVVGMHQELGLVELD
jgi:hypothetical protein